MKRIVEIIGKLFGALFSLIGELLWKGIVRLSQMAVSLLSILFLILFLLRHDEDGMKLIYSGTTVFLIVMYILSIIVLIINFGYKRRCPSCYKWFSMKWSGDKLVKCEDIQIKTEVKTKNSRGEVIGTQEQYIPGTRKFYQKNYICRKCGETSYDTYSKDVKNT